MDFCGVSLFDSVYQDLRPRGSGRRMGMAVSLIAVNLLVIVVDVWWGALLGLLVGAMLIWRGCRHRQRSFSKADHTCTSMRFNPGQRCDRPPRRAQTTLTADRVQAQRPLKKEAQLMRAEILWQLHGDRYGARGHCLDLIGKMRPEDPLFAETCNLYLRTCDSRPTGQLRPVVPFSEGASKSMRPVPVQAGGAQIIPFQRVMPDPRPASM